MCSNNNNVLARRILPACDKVDDNDNEHGNVVEWVDIKYHLKFIGAATNIMCIMVARCRVVPQEGNGLLKVARTQAFETEKPKLRRIFQKLIFPIKIAFFREEMPGSFGFKDSISFNLLFSYRNSRNFAELATLSCIVKLNVNSMRKIYFD